ncbi:MAG TPA: cytochrome c [Candidatus Angelobacter sp.]|jgi:mono/diheme cytochrome c family protein|nr:cytochrome c [Candidatus Angelobacter sp.]
MTLRKTLLSAALMLGATLLFASVGDGLWMTKVPDKARNRPNPYDSESAAVASGAKLFRQNCSACHGGEATGLNKRPNLHSERIRAATPGELEWLLKNGSMKNGMPSWSRLPEQQRWQIVSYLKSLQ